MTSLLTSAVFNQWKRQRKCPKTAGVNSLDFSRLKPWFNAPETSPYSPDSPLHFPSGSPARDAPRPTNFIAGVLLWRRCCSTFPATVARPCLPFLFISNPRALARVLIPLPEFLMQGIDAVVHFRSSPSSASPQPHRAVDSGRTRARRGHHRARRATPRLAVPSPCPGTPCSPAAIFDRSSGHRLAILRRISGSPRWKP